MEVYRKNWKMEDGFQSRLDYVAVASFQWIAVADFYGLLGLESSVEYRPA